MRGSLSPSPIVEQPFSSTSIDTTLQDSLPQGSFSSGGGSEVFSEQKLTSSKTSMNCDDTEVRTCIDSYFDHVYPIPQFSFLHRALFMSEFRRGQCPPILLKAVCAAGSLYLPKNCPSKLRTDAWVSEAESSVLENYDDTCLANIQTILILILCHTVKRRFKKVMVLLSIASRLAYISRLNHERRDLSFIESETRIRVMWALYMQESLFAGGLAEFTTVPGSNCHVRLPCPETSFAMDEGCESFEMLHPTCTKSSSNLGILAYYIRVLNLRDRILRCVRTTALETCLPDGFYDQLQEFELELYRFHEALPRSFELSERSLLLHALSPSRKTLIMLHIVWRQSFCDLYQGFFPNLKESFSATILQHVTPDATQNFQKTCSEHAVQQVNNFDLILKLDSSGSLKVTDSGIAIYAYQCAKILCQLQPNVADNLGVSTGNIPHFLESCADVLTELLPYLPFVSQIQKDICTMLRYYNRQRGSESCTGNHSEDETALEKGSSWNAVNQERMMSKYGPLDTIYRNEKGEHQKLDNTTNDDGMLPEQELAPGRTENDMVATIDDTRDLPPSKVYIPPRGIMGENDTWDNNWDFQFQDHDFNMFMYNSFEIHESFPMDP